MAIELDSHDVLVQRALVQRGLGATMTLLSIAAIAYYGTSLGGPAWIWAVLGFPGLLVGPMIYAAAGRDPHTRTGREDTLRIHEGALYIPRADQRIALGDVEGAWIEEDFVGGTLVIETRRGLTIAARFLDEQRPRVEAIMRGLGVDERLVVMRVAAAERAGRGCAGGCLTVALLLGAAPALAFVVTLISSLFDDVTPARLFATGVPALVCMTAALLSVRALSSTTLRIGADGVRVGRRFVPYGALREVRHTTGGVLFDTGQRARKVRCLGVQAASIIENVNRAVARFRDDHGQTDLTMLDRQSRSVPEWRGTLSRILDATSYRQPAVDRSALLTLVENPKATPERRAGAILALGPHATPDEKKRLRIASDTCAEPHARAIMEAALDEELEALERAIHRAEAHQRPLV